MIRHYPDHTWKVILETRRGTSCQTDKSHFTRKCTDEFRDIQKHDYSFMKQRVFVSQSLHYFHKTSGLDYSFDIVLARILRRL